MKTIGITMGDPAGIGPEIAAKALSNESNICGFHPIIIGDASIMQRALTIVKSSREIHIIHSVKEFMDGKVNILDLHCISPEEFSLGAASSKCGQAAYNYIIKAISLALRGTIDAIVTNPVNKQALKKAGIKYPGHTELLADKTGSKNYSMVFTQDNVAVAHVTTHCSLREAIRQISSSRVLNTIKLLDNLLRVTVNSNPRIAVGGLNPHAGENGMFGNEEKEHISPAIKKAVDKGINCNGPFPPDTVFMRAFQGEFDGVVSMIHDHGFVALKSRNFEKGVNITIGLPVIRTSVGHGTAFDLAGTGKAREKSLVDAMRIAFFMAKNVDNRS